MASHQASLSFTISQSLFKLKIWPRIRYTYKKAKILCCNLDNCQVSVNNEHYSSQEQGYASGLRQAKKSQWREFELCPWAECRRVKSGRNKDMGPSSKKEKHEKTTRVVGHRTYWALNVSYWWERGITWWRRRRKEQNRCWWHIGRLTSCHQKLCVFTGKSPALNSIRHYSFQISITYIYSRQKFHLYRTYKCISAYIMFKCFFSHW